MKKINKYVIVTDINGKKHKCDIEMLMIAASLDGEEDWAWYLSKKSGRLIVKTIILSKRERTRLVKFNDKYWKEMDANNL
jgi:hypothetical protein